MEFGKEITNDDLAKTVHIILSKADTVTLSRVCGYAEGLLAKKNSPKGA